MAYNPPSIGAAGLTIPAYTDILNDLLAQFQSIYGQSVYLGADSADYQFIAIIALRFADVMQAIQLAYNARSPVTAVGADLDSIVKLNGLARKTASYSTCVVTLAGTVGAVITNGVVQDVNGNSWNLPSSVTIPTGGSIMVTATAQTAGSINALPGQISLISTPTAGWTSVTNTLAAALGQPVETDSQLRARQALSVALPSSTMLAGTVAAIAATPGVTRYNVLENPTGTTDSYGNPPHSITCVVENGTNAAVAQTIFAYRGIGCYTNGTTTVTVTDPDTGAQMPINFDRPTYVPVYVSLSIHAFTNYTTQTAASIQAAVAAYLNSLQIGEIVTISALYGVALSLMPSLASPQYSIRSLTAGTSASPTGTTDIAIAFNQVAQGNAANVVITNV